MSVLNRRQAFKALLGGLLQTAGTVVVATAVLPAQAKTAVASTAGKDLEQRANQLADALGSSAAGDGEQTCSFLNGAGFRNGSFRNGGFANGGGGGGSFKNGGFANGSTGGAFKNGAFGNGSGGNFKNGFVNF
jgi:hypothetical protein